MYDVTREDILKLIEYDGDTGKIYWKDVQPEMHIGKEIGRKSINSTNYTHHLHIECRRLFGNRRVPIHRIVYFLEHGVWLEKVDHIDGDGLNNHISNLRDGTGVNNRNTVRRKPKTVNKDLPQGVFKNRTRKDGSTTYVARGTFDGFIEELYRGDDLFEACCARKSWENEQLELGRFTKRHFGRE